MTGEGDIGTSSEGARTETGQDADSEYISEVETELLTEGERRDGEINTSSSSHIVETMSVLHYLYQYYGAVVIFYFLLLTLAELLKHLSDSSHNGAEDAPNILRWFDRMFRSPLGPVFPFIVYFLCIETSTEFGRQSMKDIRKLSRKSMIGLFITLTFIRLVIYLATVSLKIRSLMSDHVFLAISISAMVQTVLLVSLLTMKLNFSVNLVEQQAVKVKMKGLAQWKTYCHSIGIVLGIAVIFLLCANSFVTFRYYHDFSEVRL